MQVRGITSRATVRISASFVKQITSDTDLITEAPRAALPTPLPKRNTRKI